eukprot:Tbor_TRINITY_DN4729_c1_g4::TRINITY_DN4729_c1_g4_i1::g.16999::m.16999
MEDLERRICNLEAQFSQSCLWFSYPAQCIIKELQGLPEYFQLKSILREANAKSPKPMCFEHIQEKLTRCKYTCECDFMRDCRAVCQVVYGCVREDMLHSPKTRVIEKRMEDLFVSHLNQPHLGEEVENRLFSFASSKCPDMAIRSKLARVLELYKENMNTPPRAMRQATLRALCCALPPVPKKMPLSATQGASGGEAVGCAVDGMNEKRLQQDIVTISSTTCIQRHGHNSCDSFPHDRNTSTSAAPAERQSTQIVSVPPTQPNHPDPYSTVTQQTQVEGAGVMRQNGHQDDFCEDISDIEVDDN